MNPLKNPVGWFEIPVKDMERAMKFYEAVFGHKLERHTMHKIDMAWFPMNPEGMGAMGSLVYNEEFYTPSNLLGPLLYFTAFSGDLQNELSKVADAGGKVLVEKTQISEEHGYMGIILDTEGNRLGIHSRA